MFTPRLRRRRHALDTYIHAEVEEQKSATQEASFPPLRQTRKPAGEAAAEARRPRAKAG